MSKLPESMPDAAPAQGVPLLLVDDDPEVREACAMVLEDAGFEVLQARHGGEALELVRARRPALVLLDLMMPEVDGLEFLDRLPRECSAPLPPVIACTAFERMEAEVLTRGARALLRKPFDVDVLLSMVEDALGVSRRRANAAARPSKMGVGSDALHQAPPELTRQLQQAVRWLPRHFGVREAFATRSTGEPVELCPPLVTSSPQARLTFARDVLRAQAPLSQTQPAGTGQLGLRWFAGAPIPLDAHRSFGTLCLEDADPDRMNAEDLAILEHLGEALSEQVRASATGTTGTAEPLFDPAGRLCPDSMAFLTEGALRRAERAQGAVALVLLEHPPASLEGLETAVERALLRHGNLRWGLGRVDEQSTSVLLEGAPAQVEQAQQEVCRAIAEVGGGHLGVATYAAVEPFGTSSGQLLATARTALGRARAGSREARFELPVCGEVRTWGQADRQATPSPRPPRSRAPG